MEGINILNLEPQDQSNENYTEGSNTPISSCNTPNDPLNLAVKRRLDQLQKTPLTPHNVISKHTANSQSGIDNIK